MPASAPSSGSARSSLPTPPSRSPRAPSACASWTPSCRCRTTPPCTSSVSSGRSPASMKTLRPHGADDLGQRGRRHQVDALRHRHQLPGRHDDLLGVAAAAEQRHDLVADRPARRPRRRPPRRRRSTPGPGTAASPAAVGSGPGAAAGRPGSPRSRRRRRAPRRARRLRVGHLGHLRTSGPPASRDDDCVHAVTLARRPRAARPSGRSGAPRRSSRPARRRAAPRPAPPPGQPAQHRRTDVPQRSALADGCQPDSCG